MSVYAIVDEHAGAEEHVDTRKAARRYVGDTGKRYWENLYQSSRGRWYILSCSRFDGEESSARWITDREAAAWLLLRSFELPSELEALASRLTE